MAVKQDGGTLAQELTSGGAELVQRGAMFFHRERAWSLPDFGLLCRSVHGRKMVWGHQCGQAVKQS